MQKWLLTGLCAVLGFTNANAQGGAYAERVNSYIERFRDLAVAEQIRSGVPASITLAQGIHETSAGSSELATEANNHFGIKCKKSWTGQTFAHTDDAPNECFRKYNSAAESYKDHSDYLASQPRYAGLFKLSATDYAAWAIGLRQAGYATNPRYAFVLIGLIEEYKLQEYTYAGLNDGTYGNYAVVKKEVVPVNDPVTSSPAPAKLSPAIARPPAAGVTAIAAKPATQTFSSTKNTRLVVNQTGNAEEPELSAMPKPQYGQLVNVNGLKAVYAKKGDMPLEYAFKHSIRYAKLLEMNDLTDRPLPADMYLYLEKKHSKGLRPMHMIKPGETMIQVAQAEGMQLKSLRALNMLEPGQEPVAGTTLELQRNAVSRPRLVGEVIAADIPATVPQEITKPAVPVVAKTKAPVIKTQTPVVAALPVYKPAPATPKPVTNNADYIAKDKIEETKTPATESVADPSIRRKREEYIASTVPEPAPAKTAETKYTNEEDTKHQEQKVANNLQAVKEDPVSEKAIATVSPVVTEVKKEEPVKEVPVVVKKEEIIKEERVKQEPVREEPIVEPVKEIPAVAKKEEPKTTPPASQPADELDALKAKFDMVVYTDTKKTEPVTAAREEEVKPAAEKSAAATPSEGTKSYTVQKGDTAFTIAKNHNITVRQLMEWNNLDFDAIKVGQKLRVK